MRDNKRRRLTRIYDDEELQVLYYGPKSAQSSTCSLFNVVMLWLR